MRTTPDNELAFENAIKSLEATTASLGVHLEVDSAARRTYAREVATMSAKLRSDVANGRLSWAQAAKEAQMTRNAVMEIIRSRSTPIGRALAQKLKLTGYTFNELIAGKTLQLFGSHAIFEKLSSLQQNKIFAAIVTSAGKANPKVSASLTRLSFVGRGLIFISVALSTYHIVTAKNKVKATKRELTTIGAGIGGSIAAGALAGLACGPAAPVCVTVGSFVGGAVAAFGAGYIW
ncbi:hypothetical protein HSX11_14405 [Oxalobacteraceae bacterium]|nr:hypothetical protein [Oxalobacteraceae bacterium]